MYLLGSVGVFCFLGGLSGEAGREIITIAIIFWSVECLFRPPPSSIDGNRQLSS